MNNQSLPLEYTFIAETFDGKVIKQSPLDRPVYLNEGSAFTEVLKEKVKRFSLIGRGHIFTVDLTDGHMEIDGIKTYPPKQPSAYPLQLIYYRQVQQNLMVSFEGQNKEMKPSIRYFIGWKVFGTNQKWEMGVN